MHNGPGAPHAKVAAGPFSVAKAVPRLRPRAAIAIAARLLLLLTVALLGVLGQVAMAETRAPSVFLAGANVPRAKALALDAALLKGWDVAESAREHVVFETLLDTPASDGPPNAADLGRPGRTLLRIRADFVESTGGVTASLRADEIWFPGRPTQWSTDVTAPYRSNLMNALASLRTQWVRLEPSAARAQPGSRRTAAARVAGQNGEDLESQGSRAPSLIERLRSLTGTRPMVPPGESSVSARTPGAVRGEAGRLGSSQPGAPSVAPRTPPAGAAEESAARTPGTAERDTGADGPLGVWAYYAEQRAVARGCTLSERGAVLVSERDGVELHRVYCAGGATMAVRCDREACRDAP
jgi:hypothetical protein